MRIRTPAHRRPRANFVGVHANVAHVPHLTVSDGQAHPLGFLHFAEPEPVHALDMSHVGRWPIPNTFHRVRR